MTIRYDETARNVMGGELEPCSLDPVTGFFRNGCCETGPEDVGQHTVCAVMTEDFLTFSLAAGNDLSTPRPELTSRASARRPLVPVRAALEGGPRRRRRPARGPGSHPRGGPRHRPPRRSEGPRGQRLRLYDRSSR